MLKVKFEKCIKYNSAEVFIKEYQSLNALEEEIFSMVKCDYTSGLQFPQVRAGRKLMPIGILPLGIFYQYKIVEIIDDEKGVLYSVADSVLSREVTEWIAHCKERQQPPRWFREGFELATRRNDIAEIMEDEKAVYFADRDSNMHTLMRVTRRDMYKAVAKLKAHQRCVVVDVKYQIPILEVNGPCIEKIHNLFIRDDISHMQNAVDNYRVSAKDEKVLYLTKKAEETWRERLELHEVV